MEPNELPDELANIRYLNTYKAPANYFDGLADDILNQVHLPLSGNMPLAAPPPQYFENLADNILSKLKNAPAQSEVQKELEEIEPLLNLVSNQNVYTVPEGYFDSFTVAIPTMQKQSEVIKMRRSRSWMSYAAAAVITGVIATGIIVSVQNNGSGGKTSNYIQALANVSDNDLSEYLDQTSQDADLITTQDDSIETKDGESIYKVLLSNVSDNELENYLNENNDGDEKNIKGI